MPNLSATVARRKFGDVLSRAQKDPVFISRNGEQVAVIISFEALRRLTGVDRKDPARPEVLRLLAQSIKRHDSLYRAIAKLD